MDSELIPPEPFPPNVDPEPLVHFFDVTTTEYLRSRRLDESQPVPEDATRVEPPPSLTGYSIVWDRTEYWNLIEDHRGEIWYTADGQPVAIVELGDPAEDGLSSTKPPA